MAAESGSLHTPPDCVWVSGKERGCLSSSPYYSGAHLYVMQFVCSFIVSVFQAVLQKAPSSELKRYSAVISFTCLWFQHFKHWNLWFMRDLLCCKGQREACFFVPKRPGLTVLGFLKILFLCVLCFIARWACACSLLFFLAFPFFMVIYPFIILGEL